jgi:hypothetical protein
MLRASPSAMRCSAPQALPRAAPRARHAAAQRRAPPPPKAHHRLHALRAAAANGHTGGSGEFAEAHAAVDALLAAAAAVAGDSRPDKHARLIGEHAAAVAALGTQLGLDRVVPAWNAGEFEGHAVSGRLRAALDAPLSLPALSFGVFTEPRGAVTLRPDASSIVKSEAGAYAVRSAFTLAPEEGPRALQGVNTVMGTFTLEDDGREMAVQFDRVSLELPAHEARSGASSNGAAALHGKSGRAGGGGAATTTTTVVERELPMKPPRVTLRVLLMTPDVTVTCSSLGSLAVLKRRARGGE